MERTKGFGKLSLWPRVEAPILRRYMGPRRDGNRASLDPRSPWLVRQHDAPGVCPTAYEPEASLAKCRQSHARRLLSIGEAQCAGRAARPRSPEHHNRRRTWRPRTCALLKPSHSLLSCSFQHHQILRHDSLLLPVDYQLAPAHHARQVCRSPDGYYRIGSIDSRHISGLLEQCVAAKARSRIPMTPTECVSSPEMTAGY